ncbi:MAG: hypothetical protein IV093_00300 [Rubrivivax sp.]|nr:hypothetical protein [Rubrivivax sp.]
MNTSKALIFAIGCGAVLAGTGARAETDQINLPGHLPGELNSHSPTATHQQEVRVGIGGALSQIDLYQSGALPFQAFRLFVNKGFNWQTDPDDFSMTVASGTGATISIDLSGSGLRFNAGEFFMLGIQGLGPDTFEGGLMLGGEYAPGRLHYNAAPQVSDRDMAFTTHMAPVPEPGSALLGLLGWAALCTLTARRPRPV